LGSNSKFKHTFFSPKVFGLVIGVIIFLLFVGLGYLTDGLKNLETQVMDLHFNLKNTWQVQTRDGSVTRENKSTKLSDDIVIIGVDNKSLETYGRWPFPRRIHADLLNSFTRIKDQNQRESAVLLDFLFNETADRAYEDVILLDSIKENGNVSLQTLHTTLSINSYDQEALTDRFQVLMNNYGELKNITGDLSKVSAQYGIESPLIPYGRAIESYGHATYKEDYDKTYRRLQLVSRYSIQINEYTFKDLKPGMDFGVVEKGHLAWENENGILETFQLPLTSGSLDNLSKDIQRRGLKGISLPDYTLTSYEDHFVPAISLTLALQYFNKSLDDVAVVYGSHIFIPSPMRWDKNSGIWIPYIIPGHKDTEDIIIPIDDGGNMLINFMGPKSSAIQGEYRTFPVRSYSRFAQIAPGMSPETWNKTNGLGGKVVMVGAFTLGMADDEKPTPMGLMFGVEIHANALNTILMENFIQKPPVWVNTLVMLVLVLFFAFITSRMKGLAWSVVILLAFVLVSFLTITILFEYQDILIDWATPILAVISTFIAVVIYRVLTAEKDKRQIKNVFGQFIAPELVEELAVSPPELGGNNINGTVLFSDIRDFSGLSLRQDAPTLVHILNDYLTVMTDNMVIDYNGTLDKYIGDAIMTFWGAPKEYEDHAVKACKSAIAQIRLLDSLNPSLMEKYNEKLAIGIGINSGSKEGKDLMVAYMGSEGRKNYTAMGDAVNLASRLEGVNKKYKSTILISEDTYDLIKHDKYFIVREIDEIRVKGRNKPVTIFELIDYEGELKDDFID